MRNYITLNGKNSNEINGLLIQELPPISKPQIRTEVEEIDGRDGDIVTKLGFAAYDKEFTVGLYKDFDINAIIAYFNSEGTVVFSNEPDKYYNYQIIDQIDFERLVRYRTATVRMHCQPFKYSNTESARTLGNKGTASGEGSFITLDNTPEAQFSKIEPKGNAEQAGTPTPDAPQPISVVTGENVVKITGKNLCYEANRVSSTSLELFANCASISDSTITLSLITDYTSARCSVYVFVDGVDLSTRVGYLSTTANVRSSAALDLSSVMTQIKAGSVLRLLVYRSGAGFTSISEAQLELGSTATAYEPYQGQSYEINLGSIELAKIGTYQDRIYKEDSKWYIEKQVGKVVLDGSETWAYYSSYGGFRYRNNKFNVSSNNPSEDLICSHFTVATVRGAPPTAPVIKSYALNADSTYIFLCDGTSDVDAFKTWLASNNTTVYYALATPTTTEITNEALIAQLEALYNQAHAYKGRTHVAAIAQSGNAPHIIEAEVQRSSDGNITNNGNIVSKPTLTIYGSGNIGVSLNGYQIFEITLGDEEYITIDTAAMEAYKDTLDNLKNRLVNGDYSKFALRPGSNMIEFSGTVSKCVISKYSRWL